jgi:nucleotide-binding universal stress UspA family protein
MFKSILVPLDLDEPGSWKKALPVAQDLTKSGDARLSLGTVISDWDATRNAQWSPIGLRRMIGEAERKLRKIAEAAGSEPHGVHATIGAVGAGIIEIAMQVEADLIVLASHKPGMRDHLIGANALHVVRHAPCSVFVVRE